MDAAHHLVQKAWGKQVRRARKALDLSQIAAAERVGIDQSTLSRIETGDYRQLHPEMVLRLCVALSIDPDDAFRWPPAIVEIARMKTEVAA